MMKKGELLNIMPKRCRICLVDNGFMLKLHDRLVESKLKDLTRCTCIDIEYKKNLPDEICHICFYKLSMWTEFKELFIQSHKILLEQLEILEAPDNAVNNSENNRHLKENMKRTHFNRSSSISPINKKKSKIDVSLSEVTNVNTEQVIIDTIYISDSEDESILSKNSLQKACNINKRKLNKNEKNNSEEYTENKSPLESKRSKLLRVKCNRNKRRTSALKRWQERKKTLYIATGKVSDSESAGSNDAQLTPVQKAQAKTNEDKEVKKRKRIANVLKKLKTNLTEKYIGFHDTSSDIGTPRTRLRNQAAISPSENNIKRKSRYYSMEKESSSSSMENNVTANDVRKSISQTNNSTFIPKSQNELVIDKATFIVTSNLRIQDQQCNQTLNNSKNPENSNGDVNGNSEEKNTDIIDAVQLRRVSSTFEKDYIKETKNDMTERCLDVRIQSHEFTMLKHMPSAELSDFIQKEVKQKLSVNKDIAKTDSVNNMNSQPKFDQELKTVIQDIIEKTIEHLKNETNAEHQGFQRVSPEFVKAAMHLPQYQPKVMVKRLDLTNKDNINDALKETTLKSASHRTIHKRLIVPPRKYNDFNISYNSDTSDFENAMIQETPRATYSRTYKNSTMKQFRNKIAVAIDEQINKRNDSIVTNKDAKSSFVKKDLNGEKNDKNSVEMKNLTDAEIYVCDICKLKFNNAKDIEMHIRASHLIAQTFVMSVNKNTDNNTLPRQKQKKMRCKKCHEIVEYQCVKTHAFSCKKITQVYVCHICDSNFHVKKLFLQHLETHHTSKLTNTIGNKEMNNVDASLQMGTAVSTTSQESQTVGLQLPTVFDALQKGYAIQTNREGICVMPLKNKTNETNVQSSTIDKSNMQSDKITATDAKFDVARTIVEKDKEYNCFLCDKIFTDEEILKDHLQQHCDDLSDEEQNNKDLHECTICGNILNSDQALEEHICKHWFDGDDTNNLTNKSLKNENETDSKTTEDEIYQCSHCWEMFDSKVLLEMHTKIHEILPAKPKRQIIYQYQCMLCDDILDTEKDLMDHVNLHNESAQVCQLCEKPFQTLVELQEHVTTHFII